MPEMSEQIAGKITNFFVFSSFPKEKIVCVCFQLQNKICFLDKFGYAGTTAGTPLRARATRPRVQNSPVAHPNLTVLVPVLIILNSGTR